MTLHAFSFPTPAVAGVFFLQRSTRVLPKATTDVLEFVAPETFPPARWRITSLPPGKRRTEQWPSLPTHQATPSPTPTPVSALIVATAPTTPSSIFPPNPLPTTI